MCLILYNRNTDNKHSNQRSSNQHLVKTLHPLPNIRRKLRQHDINGHVAVIFYAGYYSNVASLNKQQLTQFFRPHQRGAKSLVRKRLNCQYNQHDYKQNAADNFFKIIIYFFKHDYTPSIYSFASSISSIYSSAPSPISSRYFG